MDVGGKENQFEHIRKYFNQSKAIFFVIDGSNSERI
jgi:hypothetical protein